MTRIVAIALSAACASSFIAITQTSAFFPSRFQAFTTSSSGTSTPFSQSMSSSSARPAISSSSEASRYLPLAEPTKAADKLNCMFAASGHREDMIAAALQTYSATMSGALAARKALILQAWSDTNNTRRQQLLKSIWRDFAMTWRDNGQAMQQSIKSAWDQYRTDRSFCGLAGFDFETGGVSADSQL